LHSELLKLGPALMIGGQAHLLIVNHLLVPSRIHALVIYHSIRTLHYRRLQESLSLSREKVFVLALMQCLVQLAHSRENFVSHAFPKVVLLRFVSDRMGYPTTHSSPHRQLLWNRMLIILLIGYLMHLCKATT
jgi:hypothetical protein